MTEHSPSPNSLASINGHVVTLDQATVPATDRGLLFGDSVFESIVAFGTKTLDPSPHLTRLRDSAARVRIPIPWSDEELLFELEGLCHKLGAAKTQLRLVVTRGDGFGLGTPKGRRRLSPNKYLYAIACQPAPPSIYRDGIALQSYHQGYTDRGGTIKTPNYLRSIVAIDKLRDGFQDILWTNQDGEITESSIANIFFVGRFGDQVEVATPALTSGLLAGTTRQRLIRLLGEAQIPVTERVIFREELPSFDEAFLCSSVRGLVAVSQIDEHRLHSPRPRASFRHFERLYLSWVTSQIGYPVDWNSGQRLV